MTAASSGIQTHFERRGFNRTLQRFEGEEQETRLELATTTLATWSSTN